MLRESKRFVKVVLSKGEVRGSKPKGAGTPHAHGRREVSAQRRTEARSR